MIWNTPLTDQPPISITVPDRDVLLQDLACRMESEQGFAVATLNLDHVVKLRTDPAFRAAYRRHTHITADGNPIVWLSRLAGQQVALVPGSDLVDPLAGLAGRQAVPVGLFGASEMSLNMAADALKARYPALEIPFMRAPRMGFDPDGAEAAQAIADMRDSGVGLCFLALGAPKQERFAARALAELPQVGFVSIGAGLDFISGQQSRAPEWMRAVALEWLWRLLNDPVRLWRRYGKCALAMPRLTARAIAIRFSGRKDHEMTS